MKFANVGRGTQYVGPNLCVVVSRVIRPQGRSRSVSRLLFFALVLLALSARAWAQLTPGEPVVGCANPPNANCPPNPNPKAFTSGLFLDASQFVSSTGMTDMCGQINAALNAADTTPPPVLPVTIDARAFTGVQPCNLNPFKGHNLSVRLLLGNVYIVTGFPWWTPQLSHSIEGVATGSGFRFVTSLIPVGTTIAACGNGLLDNPPNQIIWNGVNCTAGGVTVNPFPNGVTLQAFTVPHGPFKNISSTYACLLCGGGESGGTEGSGWNLDGAGEQISNITLDLGGGLNNSGIVVFGYYTLSSQERTVFSNMKWTDYGTQGGAGYFFDRTEAPTGTGMPGAPKPA
jgi:hypothetical protein